MSVSVSESVSVSVVSVSVSISLYVERQREVLGVGYIFAIGFTLKLCHEAPRQL